MAFTHTKKVRIRLFIKARIRIWISNTTNALKKLDSGMSDHPASGVSGTGLKKIIDANFII
jgi:hypothetical protein